MTRISSKFYAILLCVFYHLLAKLSELLNVSRAIVGMIVLAIVIVSLFITNNVKTIYLSKDALDMIGLMFSILFVIIMASCYIIEHKNIRQCHDGDNVSVIEQFFDKLASSLNGKTIPFVHVLLIATIAIALFSKSSMFVNVLNLIATIFAPNIQEILKKKDVFQKDINHEGGT